MELELLKEIWKEADNKPANDTASGEAILEMTKKADLSIVSGMRRNLLIEVIVVLVCVTAKARYFFALSLSASSKYNFPKVVFNK